jgi:hypothetical protein
MKLMKDELNMADGRFAACTRGTRLLIFLPEAARRATANGLSGKSGFSAGCHFRDLTPHMSKNILTRHGIFRGKISRRKNQNQNNRLEERTHPRQTL